MINAGAHTDIRKVNVGHLACGSGAGAKGFRKGNARVGNMVAEFENVGGVDIDESALRDFERFAGCKGTKLDLMSLEQYRAFYGKEPPLGWREAMPADLLAAMQHKHLHIAFISAPCKGFSGLLSEKISLSPRYQALNGLTLRAIWLLLEAYKDDPVEFILFENVPRIAKRGRKLLDAIASLLAAYGYAWAETAHDCGELGGLAQSRKRFLGIARHREKVPPFLYEPPKRRLRGVGEILDRLPLPGDSRAGPMHRMPALQWKTWVRLAFVEAGSDWRSLNKLRVEDGMLADYRIAPGRGWNNGALGVNRWDDVVGTVTANGRPAAGAFSVADPRAAEAAEQYGQYGVRAWDETMGAVINVKSPGQGGFAVADPRSGYGDDTHKNVYRIVEWSSHAGAVTGGHGPSSGGQGVADPRTGSPEGTHTSKFAVQRYSAPARTVTPSDRVGSGAACIADPRTDRRSGAFGVVAWPGTVGTVQGESLPSNGMFAVADPRQTQREDYKQTKYRVTGYGEAAGTVISASTTGNGAFAVADPRPGYLRGGERDAYGTAGMYGVLPWATHSGAVQATGQYDNGRWSVADPRDQDGQPGPALPGPNDKVVAMIRALDGTWHRPFTTFELAALQSLFDPEEWFGFEMDGKSDSHWREHIGNAVPPDSATAIANVIGRTLLLAWSGETFMISNDPIWVQPLTIALAVETPALQLDGWAI